MDWEVIGNGANSEVVRCSTDTLICDPPLPPHSPQTLVIKMMAEAPSTQREKNLWDEIMKLDNENQYFCHYLHYAKIPSVPTNIQLKIGPIKCEQDGCIYGFNETTQTYDKDIPIFGFFMEDGWYPFTKYLNYIPFEEIIQGLKHLAEGLSLLESNGYFHGDVKENNIIYHPERKQFRWIDFTFLHKTNHIENILKFDCQYPIWAPNVRYRIAIEKCKRDFAWIDFYLIRDYAQYMEDLGYDYQEYKKYFAQLYQYKREGVHFERFDVFGFGIMLLSILQKYPNLREVSEANPKWKEMGVKMIHPFPEMRPSFLQVCDWLR